MRMIRRIVTVAALTWLVAFPTQAQDARVEIQGLVGWTVSDGVRGDPFVASDGNTYNRIDPKSSVSYGASIGFFVTEQVQVGFLWDRQDSTLQALGTATTEVSPLNIDNYHGFFSFHLGDSDETVRPYVMGGLGATRYSNITVTPADGAPREVSSSSRLSTTWGAGVKIYPTRNVGFNAGVRWTPTWIKTDSAGWWGDPWWGCWVVGDTQYSNQWEFAGGLSLRF